MPNKILSADKRAKGLIFDLDGTLLDSIGLHWEAWKTACLEYGVEIDRDYFLSQTGKPMTEIAKILVDRYNIAADAKRIEQRKNELVYARLDHVQPIAAVANVARENFGKVPMSVGTGSDRHRAELMLQKSGLMPLFCAIVSADDVENYKPAPDTFLRCAQLMGVKPEECQVFEDGELGLQAARACGMIATDVKPYY